MKPCWSCGVQDEECSIPCECAKCLEPENYEDWKQNSPEQYQTWVDEQLDG